MAGIRGFIVLVLGLAVLGVYLFVTAPPPLAEDVSRPEDLVSTRLLFELCFAENAAARKLYTERIVAAGSKVGLKFDEKWREPGVHAGPLPALFLRETASSLEKSRKTPARLGLFLGSDHPVRLANRFSGVAADVFAKMRKDRAPHFFEMSDVKLQAAMFPDIAAAQACVDCHNQHPESTKRDWKLGDVMGATTWTYPAASVSKSDALRILAALRGGFAATYEAYLGKAREFSPPPTIGDQWPDTGYFLPDTRVFMDAINQRTSKATLDRLLALR